MTVLTILTTGALCIVCFFIGAKVGQTASKGEPIEIPKVNPMQKIREIQDKKEAKREQEQYEVLMRNIEVYDGTSNGQKEVPRG